MRELDLSEFKLWLQSVEPVSMTPNTLTKMAARIAITASKNPAVMKQAHEIVGGE